MFSLKIEDIIRFAENLGLDRWDYIALSISSTTLIISFISLIIACKTLKSQKKTEQNTAPDINPEVQLELSQKYMSFFYSTIFDLIALNYALVKTNFTTKPSHQFWSRFIDYKDYLFDKVFYGDLRKFNSFNRFKRNASEYNKGIERLELLLKENAPKEEIVQEFGFLYQCVLRLHDFYLRSLHDSFELETSEIIETYPFKDYFSEGVISWFKGDEDINDESLIKEQNQKSVLNSRIECDILSSLKDSLNSLHLKMGSTIYNFFTSYFPHSLNYELRNKVEIAVHDTSVS